MNPPVPSKFASSRLTRAATITPEQRVLAGFEHSEFAIGVVEDGILDRNPHADDATIERLLWDMRQLENRRVPGA